MADSAVAITAGTGTNIDTRTEGTNSNHRQVIVIGDPATNAGVAPVDATNGLAVDVKAIVPGSGATNLGKAEDAAHSSSDVGVMALAVRKDTSSTGIGADGDYVPLAVSSTGHLYATIDSTQLAASVTSDQASNAAGQVVRIPPQEVHLGEVGGKTVIKTITMTPHSADSVTANGVTADTQQLDGAFRKTDGTGVLQSLTVFDYADNAAHSFSVLVHRTSTSLGTEDAAVSIADADASAGIIGVINFTSSDYTDLINGGMYHKQNIGLPVVAVSGTDDLYFSIRNGSSTPTYSASGIIMVAGILQD